MSAIGGLCVEEDDNDLLTIKSLRQMVIHKDKKAYDTYYIISDK